MVDNTSLTNLALQSFGSRTTLTAAQLAAGSNNEAKQSNLVFANTRDSLLRMAPWDCAMKTANLTYITSTPGTPENTSAATELWQPGQPRPPWAYEYQYPVDCLKACWMIPSTQTGFSGVPITTAVTGGAPTSWNGAPVRFKVGTDEFLSATAVAVATAGSGYAANDLCVMEAELNTAELTNIFGTFNASQPQGAQIVVRVLTVNGSGGVLTAELVGILPDSSTTYSGSLFYTYAQAGNATVDVDTTTGSGTGAQFTFTISTSTKVTQRVIYTNQEDATLCYVKQMTDPNVWDPQFQDAFVQFLGANMCYALTGDKALANTCIQEANRLIMEARKSDGNEGLTINNVTPDWIRGRGYAFGDTLYSGPWSNFDWGGLLPGW